jgi:hypothetical protein
MLALKYVLMIVGLGLFGSAGALAAYDVYIAEQLRGLLTQRKTVVGPSKKAFLAQSAFRASGLRLQTRRMNAI